MAHFDKAAYERYAAGDPCLDHLMTFSKFNILRAFLDNFWVIGLTTDQMDDGILSPFNNPPYASHDGLPPSLMPTVTQLTTPHLPWLDSFPFPAIRDNLIRVAESSNDCLLCGDIMDPANGDIGMMVSPFFIQMWAWVIRGCPEMILSSNRWRARRGLKRLAIPQTA
ncbi:hypothetical protein BJX70DRAFT_391299 [Aspergillus crustosus]